MPVNPRIKTFVLSYKKKNSYIYGNCIYQALKKGNETVFFRIIRTIIIYQECYSLVHMYF